MTVEEASVYKTKEATGNQVQLKSFDTDTVLHKWILHSNVHSAGASSNFHA